MRTDKRFIWVFFIYTGVLAGFFALSRLLLHGSQYWWALLLLAAVTALFACVGGFFRLYRYFWLFTALNGAGVLFMLLVSLEKGTGWGDLASLFTFAVFALTGLFGGCLLEAGLWLYRRLRRSKSKALTHQPKRKKRIGDTKNQR